MSNISVIVVAGILIWTVTVGRGPAVAGANIEPQSVDDTIAAEFVGHRIGSADLTLIEFADFECPFCARHATSTFPRLKTELIEQGRVSYAFVQFPLTDLHPNAQAASEAAECAGVEGRYWPMHEVLFKNQGRLSVDRLRQYATELGFESSSFSECMKGKMTSLVRKQLEEGQRLGVTGTPAFFLGTRQPNGDIRVSKRLDGALPYEQFAALIESAENRPTPWWKIFSTSN